MFRRLIPLLVLAVAAGPLAAQRSTPRPVVDRATIEATIVYRMYTDPAVQAELKLTDEQKAKIAKIPDDVLAKHKEEIAKEEAARKATAEKSAAVQVEMEKQFDALLAKHLSEGQRKRLGQLSLQARGVAAFRDEEVAKALALPEGYQAKLAAIQQAGREKMLKEFPKANAFPPSLTPEEQQKRIEVQRQMTQETFAQFVDTFTAEQKKKWKELTGEPSDAVTSGVRGGFVGGGGRGVPGGPPGGGFGGGGFGGPGLFPVERVLSLGVLLTNEKVLDELKVEKAAREALATGWVTIQELPNKETNDKRNALQADLQKQLDSLLEKTLTADQRTRLGQLATQALLGQQAAAANVFEEADVARALALTPSQKDKYAGLQAAGREKLQKEFPNYIAREADAETRRKYTAARRQMEQDTATQFVDTFTDAQKKTWKDLTGEPSETVKAGNLTSGALAGIPNGGSPFTRFYWQAVLLTNEKALTELKVEKPAREALATGWKAIQDAGRAGNADDGFAGRTGGFAPSVQTTATRDAAALAAQVLTPAQAKRLEQIRFQLSGTEVFSTSSTLGRGAGTTTDTEPVTLSLLAKLTPTPAQVVKIDAILADTAAKLQEVTPRFGGAGGFGGGPGGFVPRGVELTEEQKARLDAARKAAEETRQKVNDIEQKALAEILATFDVGQKAVWKEMTGEPIDLSKFVAVAPVRSSRPTFTGPGSQPGTPRAIPSIVTVWSREASVKANRGEYAAALAAYDEAIRLAPTVALYQQEKAFLLATCSSEWARDGKLAVEIMTKVIAQTKEPVPRQFSYLAMAHAEAGQFDEAVKVQEKAIALLTSEAFSSSATPDATQQYQDRLKLYQEKKPYHTAPPTPRTQPAVPTGRGR